jgi:glycosyltransferase involved in cell wall biosynthesis
MDNISILMPTFNRRKFLPFIIRNLKVQDYPHKKLQLVIYDDGDEPLIEDYNIFKEAIKPIKLKLIRNKKRANIGYKRNYLVQHSNHNIVVFMDDDDLYEATYISHSHHILKENQVGCVGCDKMIFIYPPYTKNDFYALNAGDKYLIHEATMMFYKSWYNKTEGFINCNRAEGLGITRSSKRKTIALTNPFKTMTAVVHGKNTIVKDKFKTDENNLADMSIDEKTTDFINSVCNNTV